MLLPLVIALALAFVPHEAFGKTECRTQLDSNDRSSKVYQDVFKFTIPKRVKVGQTPELPQGDSVKFECGTGFARKDLPEKSYSFECIGGKFNRSFPLEEIQCKSDYHKNSAAVQISPGQLRSSVFKCDSPDLQVYNMKTLQSDGSAKVLYTVCLDAKVMRPKFAFQPARDEKPPRHLAQEERNSVWGFDGYGRTVDEMLALSKGYVENIQKTRTTNSFPQKYNKKKQYPYYFNRGHLVPFADFAEETDRKATCEYLNAAPQWDLFNKNSWSLVEREARLMRQTNPSEWEVYTGTYGHIPTTRGPLYLAPIFENGKFKRGLLPTPMLYWKLVYNTVDKTKSKAFVGVNNPEIRSTNEIVNKYKMCTPIPGKDNHLYEGSEFLGFTYQCKVDEFLRALKADEKIVKDSFTF